jgi:hypothetical protein
MARRVKVGDPAALKDLIAANVEGMEPGLQIVEVGLRLGAATVDLVALDTSGSLVLISVGSADHETLLALVDAYLWCLVNPDNIHRLYPNADHAAVQPPRIVFVAEQFSESFLNSARQLSVTRIEAIEVQQFEVKGESVLCFEALATRDAADDAAPEPEAAEAAVSDEADVAAVPDAPEAIVEEEPVAVEQSPGEWDTFLSNLGVEPANAPTAGTQKPETPAVAPTPAAPPAASSSFAAKAPAAKPVPPAPKPAAPAPPAKPPVASSVVESKPAAKPVEARLAAAPAKPAVRAAALMPTPVPNVALANAAKVAPAANGTNVTPAATGAAASFTPTNAVPPPPAPAADKQTRLFTGAMKTAVGASAPQARATERAWLANQEESGMSKLKIVRTADEMSSAKAQSTPAGTKQAPAVKPGASEGPQPAVPTNGARTAADARAVVPVVTDEQKAVVAAPAHPALESLKFPKDGLSRQWLEFLNQLAAQK